MKGTDLFKQTIQAYLDQRAKEDALFAISYAKKGKNINDCITYILNRVRSSGCNGFEDSEIYGMAVHYYDEDNLKVGKPVNGRVVINHSVKEERRASFKQPVRANVGQLSLFDL